MGILVAYEAEPVGGHFHHVLQVVVDACHLLLHAGNELVGLFFVELEYAAHLDFHQS